MINIYIILEILQELPYCFTHDKKYKLSAQLINNRIQSMKLHGYKKKIK